MVSRTTADLSAPELIIQLALQPHPEGGWYREIYRSPTLVATARGSRSALTTIYYLLEQGQLSRWHVVQADELWHFYAGEPLELLEYDPTTGKFAQHVLGAVGGVAAAVPSDHSGVGGPLGGVSPTGVSGPPAAAGGSRARAPAPVAVIPTGVWQAARSLGTYSLLGCTVGPGFEFADFQFVSDLPAHAGHFKGDLALFVDLL